jgi:dGTPase
MKTAKTSYGEFDFERRGDHGSATKDRKAFEIDKGRIIHCAAFRRLQGKTQVLGVGERDFYRTRLTHSIEVAQLGRGLCNELEGSAFEPDQDLVEAICLAHDIGHPPFGHSGEDFLHAKMKGQRGGFGANPQNLRLVTLLEAKYLDSGLDLTRATLDGLVKYPNLYNCEQDRGSKFTYINDSELLAWIKKGLKNSNNTPVEAQLADWADQMAYSVNDIEDIVRAGLLRFNEMRSRAQEISDKVSARLRKAASSGGYKLALVPKVTGADAIVELANELEDRYEKPSELRQRKANLKAWTSKTIKLLKKNCKIVDLQNGEKSVRYRYQLTIGAEARARATVLKTIAGLLVFSDPRVMTLEDKGRHIINELFDKFSGDGGENLLPLDFQELIKAKKFGSKERLVADFIAGMTDRYAYGYYKRLFHPDAGSFYEFV